VPALGDAVAASPPRILHAPADVGGHAYGLSRAERQLGLRSDVAVLAAGPFGYEADIRLDLEGSSRWRGLALRANLLGRALRSYDIIHFNFGQSLIPLWTGGHVFNELPLLKRAGKTILVTFQGCDVRPVECCFCKQEHCRAENPYRAPNAARFLRYADRVFHLNPDLRKWLPGSRFLPYAHVDPARLTPVAAPAAEPAKPTTEPTAEPTTEPTAAREQLVVAHAPTNRDVKGTAHVLEAIERLRSEGVPVRLDLIEGVPHTEVLRRLREADLVVDQLLIGWYGGFAVEAMALGKPVLCHIQERSAEDNPFGEELPIVRCDPSTLASVLRELMQDRERLLRVGRASRAFVEHHHDPRSIAREVLAGIV
jgi:glycosyltransferase involved in cell wall biosynthesis